MKDSTIPTWISTPKSLIKLRRIKRNSISIKSRKCSYKIKGFGSWFRSGIGHACSCALDKGGSQGDTARDIRVAESGQQGVFSLVPDDICFSAEASNNSRQGPSGALATRGFRVQTHSDWDILPGICEPGVQDMQRRKGRRQKLQRSVPGRYQLLGSWHLLWYRLQWHYSHMLIDCMLFDTLVNNL